MFTLSDSENDIYVANSMKWLKVDNCISGRVSVQCEVLYILVEPIITIVGLGLGIVLGITSVNRPLRSLKCK